MCMFGLSGCRVKPRRLWGRRGQTCTCQGPDASTPPKFHERTPKREKKEENCGGRREKKREMLCSPPFRAPPLHQDGRVGEEGRGREGEDFGPSRTNLYDIFLPKSNKGPIGLSRIGPSRMGLTRINTLAKVKLA